MTNKPTICVLGLGYIGLPTALLFAEFGCEVVGFDTDALKIDSLNAGKLYFYEPGLAALFRLAMRQQTFRASNSAVKADVYILAVPTPNNLGLADLTYIKSALQLLQPVMPAGAMIVLESTVGPLDCVQHIIPMIEKWHKPFLFVHCPERAIPGATIQEMRSNDRIIGGINQKSQQRAKTLYSNITTGQIFLTDPTTAAACKVFENTFRSTNIALANEFAQLAEAYQINVWEVIKLANRHPRVNIHQPGPGVGGHCIPIDPWFLVHDGQAKLTQLGLDINQSMPELVTQAITQFIKVHKLPSPTIGILGSAYKKNTNDKRESPSQYIVDQLLQNYRVLVTDPFVTDPTQVPLNHLLTESQVVVLVTDHDKYKRINFTKYPNLKVLYDTRGFYTQKSVANTQIAFYQLGVGH